MSRPDETVTVANAFRRSNDGHAASAADNDKAASLSLLAGFLVAEENYRVIPHGMGRLELASTSFRGLHG